MDLNILNTLYKRLINSTHFLFRVTPRLNGRNTLEKKKSFNMKGFNIPPGYIDTVYLEFLRMSGLEPHTCLRATGIVQYVLSPIPNNHPPRAVVAWPLMEAGCSSSHGICVGTGLTGFPGGGRGRTINHPPPPPATVTVHKKHPPRSGCKKPFAKTFSQIM